MPIFFFVLHKNLRNMYKLEHVNSVVIFIEYSDRSNEVSLKRNKPFFGGIVVNIGGITHLSAGISSNSAGLSERTEY
jgi:hypothetical protein